MCAFADYRANLHRRAVSRALRAWKEEKDITSTALAEAAGWSGAKMSMLLNAVCPISEADLLILAMILKIDPVQRDLAYNSALRAREPENWNGRSSLSWSLDELEAEASEVRIVATEIVPPLLQTQAYAGAVHAAQAAVLSEYRSPYSDESRRATLTRLGQPTPLRVHVVISEAVLQRIVGAKKVMADQVLWLVQLCVLAGVTLQVVPNAVGAYPGMGGAFTMLSFLERQFDDVVAVEQLHTTNWLESNSERLPYVETFAKLKKMALSPVDSVEFLTSCSSGSSG